MWTLKKLLGIVVLGLLWCNVSFAEIYELKKCHNNKFSDWNAFYIQQDKGGSGKDYIKDIIEDFTITINSDAGTITRTLFRKKETVDNINKYIQSTGLDLRFKKITQTIFEITTFTSDIITAEMAKYNDDKSIITKSSIYVNLDNGSFDIVSKNLYPNKKKIMPDTEVSYICDEYLGSSAGTQEASSSSGTAFFINNRGNLLTNNHVVDGCKSLSINYNNKEYDAQLIAKDKTLDLALLKANVRSKSFINFSNYNPKKLQKIYVAGYPFGKGLSDDLKISSGIISSLKGVQDNSNELQIDAAINHGNSGGPIVGEGGELIAIAVSGLGKEMSEGINFGIKSSAALNFLGANDIDPSRSNRNKLNNDKLLKILEESTLYISCTY